MKLSSTAIAVVVVVAFAGGVLGAQVAGVWQTEGSKTPARLATGAFAGEYDPADIRGSYSFGDIGEAFEVPVSALAAAYGVGNTDNPEAILVKTLEEAFEGLHEELEIGTDSVRLFVAKYLDRPITSPTRREFPRPLYPSSKSGEPSIRNSCPGSWRFPPRRQTPSLRPRMRPGPPKRKREKNAPSGG